MESRARGDGKAEALRKTEKQRRSGGRKSKGAREDGKAEVRRQNAAHS